MRKRRDRDPSDVIFNDDRVVITKLGDEWIFEIGQDITQDIAEAVSLLMRRVEHNDPVWKMELKNIILEHITPEKSLFWLTGGRKEWDSLHNYKRPWHDCYLDFQEEYGLMVLRCVDKSKSLSDIRDNFLKYLNLPILYNFAVSKNLV